MGKWQFLSNHALVLLCISEDAGIRLRDIAAAVGITERAAHRIVDELEADGYISRDRIGRRNHYTLRKSLPLRHPLIQDRKLADLLALFGEPEGSGRSEVTGADESRRKSRSMSRKPKNAKASSMTRAPG